eukprot:94377-Prorocentrum_minimum.AAC.1
MAARVLPCGPPADPLQTHRVMSVIYSDCGTSTPPPPLGPPWTSCRHPLAPLHLPPRTSPQSRSHWSRRRAPPPPPQWPAPAASCLFPVGQPAPPQRPPQDPLRTPSGPPQDPLILNMDLQGGVRPASVRRPPQDPLRTPSGPPHPEHGLPRWC